MDGNVKELESSDLRDRSCFPYRPKQRSFPTQSGDGDAEKLTFPGDSQASDETINEKERNPEESRARRARFHLTRRTRRATRPGIARNTKQPRIFFSPRGGWKRMEAEMGERGILLEDSPPSEDASTLPPSQTVKNEKCTQIPGNLAIFRAHALTSGYKTISRVEPREKTRFDPTPNRARPHNQSSSLALLQT